MNKLIINLNFHIAKQLKKISYHDYKTKKSLADCFYPNEVSEPWKNGDLFFDYFFKVMKIIKLIDLNIAEIHVHISGVTLDLLEQFNNKGFLDFTKWVISNKEKLFFSEHSYYSSLSHLFSKPEYVMQKEMHKKLLIRKFGENLNILPQNVNSKKQGVHFNFTTHQTYTPENIDVLSKKHLSKMQLEACEALFKLEVQLNKIQNEISNSDLPENSGGNVNIIKDDYRKEIDTVSQEKAQQILEYKDKLEKWRLLQVADHIYYISDHWLEEDGIPNKMKSEKVKLIEQEFNNYKKKNNTIVHNDKKSSSLNSDKALDDLYGNLLNLNQLEYEFGKNHINPHLTPYEAFINFMNIIDNF